MDSKSFIYYWKRDLEGYKASVFIADMPGSQGQKRRPGEQQIKRHDHLMPFYVCLPEACVSESPSTFLEDINNQPIILFLGLLLPVFVTSKHCSKVCLIYKFIFDLCWSSAMAILSFLH